jgi:ribosomal protein S18 acetylase RimI-like enzyme
MTSAASGTNRRVTDSELRFRLAGPDDAAAVAELHGDSWRRHYRGAYADAFLDDESAEYLDAMWAGRLAARAGTRTTIAEYGGKLVGLSHLVIDADPKFGALVDNLHVRAPLKRQGIGTQLLALTAEDLESGIYLWVLEQNTAAQGFYEARGGIRGDRQAVPPPGGEPRRLNGTPACFRYYWPDPSVLAATA